MSKRKQPRFRCKTKAQKKAIRRSYAIKSSQKRVEAPYPHFRYYRKSGHPALIVGEQKGSKMDNKGIARDVDEYRYRKVTHSDTEGGRKNELVYPNPNPNDTEPMYIAKRVRHDEKDNFEDTPLPWKYPKK